MIDREKVIKGLECCMVGDGHSPKCEICPYATVGDDTCQTMDALFSDAIALLKAQEPATVEPKRIELADETKAWLDTMDAVEALWNIADICIDWDGYRTADGLGGLINEIWAYARYCAKKLMEAQEPVKPVFSRICDHDISIFACSGCGKEISAWGLAHYCPHCGKAVKWDG